MKWCKAERIPEYYPDFDGGEACFELEGYGALKTKISIHEPEVLTPEPEDVGSKLGLTPLTQDEEARLSEESSLSDRWYVFDQLIKPEEEVVANLPAPPPLPRLSRIPEIDFTQFHPYTEPKFLKSPIAQFYTGIHLTIRIRYCLSDLRAADTIASTISQVASSSDVVLLRLDQIQLETSLAHAMIEKLSSYFPQPVLTERTDGSEKPKRKARSIEWTNQTYLLFVNPDEATKATLHTLLKEKQILGLFIETTDEPTKYKEWRIGYFGNVPSYLSIVIDELYQLERVASPEIAEAITLKDPSNPVDASRIASRLLELAERGIVIRGELIKREMGRPGYRYHPFHPSLVIDPEIDPKDLKYEFYSPLDEPQSGEDNGETALETKLPDLGTL